MAALSRRAEAAGAYVSLARRGASEAGAVFVVVDRKDGGLDLYGPAPQSVFGAGGPADRLFYMLAKGESESAIGSRLEQEIRFDPDLWLVDIEDRQGRPFLELVSDPR